tara:strand:- start:58 stop:321 length:264 start_codon:yes stop_codon:yes gene_type:complete
MGNRLADMLFFSGNTVITKLTDKIVDDRGTRMDYVTILAIIVMQACIVVGILWIAFTLIWAASLSVLAWGTVDNTPSVLAGQFVGAR